jgi:hypothetical protein
MLNRRQRPQSATHREELRARGRNPPTMSWPERILLVAGILFFACAFALIALMLGDLSGGGDVRVR